MTMSGSSMTACRGPGGKHGPIQGAVELDTIGCASGDTLVEGKTHPFHIFMRALEAWLHFMMQRRWTRRRNGLTTCEGHLRGADQI